MRSRTRTLAEVLQTPKAWWGLLASLALVAGYNALFFNSYFPVDEAWWPSYARWMAEGRMPYRDFHLFLTPLYPRLVQALQALLGPELLTLRIVGVGVVLAFAATVYLLFVSLASASTAFLITVVTVIYYQSGNAHIAYDFIQFVTLFGCLGTLLACRAYALCDSAEPPRSVFVLLALAGCCWSLGFLFKQSNGLLIGFFGLVGTLLTFRGQPRPVWWRVLLWLCAGGVLPVLATAAWLGLNGAMAAGIDQFYGGATRSKGSLSQALFRWLADFTYRFEWESWLGGIWYWPLVLGYFRLRTAPAFGGEPLPNQQGLLRAAMARRLELPLLVLLAAAVVLLAYADPDRLHPLLALAELELPYIVPLAFFLSAIGFVVVCCRGPDARHILPLYALSMGLIWGNGTSFGVNEGGSFIGVGLLLLLLMESRSFVGIGRWVACVLALCFLAFLARTKFDMPYEWWGLQQLDARGPRVTLEIPGVRGIRVRPEEREMVEAGVAAIRRHPGQDVFCFPHVPLFYFLTGTWPPGRALVHWFDFLPDDLARREAELIAKSRPGVIIFMRLPEFVYSSHESMFRNGEPSGQRDVRRVLEKKMASGDYRLAGSYPLPREYTLEIWELR